MTGRRQINLHAARGLIISPVWHGNRAAHPRKGPEPVLLSSFGTLAPWLGAPWRPSEPTALGLGCFSISDALIPGSTSAAGRMDGCGELPVLHKGVGQEGRRNQEGLGKVLHQEHSPHPVSLRELLTVVFLTPANPLAPETPWLRGWDAWEPGPPQTLCTPCGMQRGWGGLRSCRCAQLLPGICPAVAMVTLPFLTSLGEKKASKHLILQPTWEPFKLPIRCLTCNNFSAFKIILKCSFSFSLLKSQQWSLRKKSA